MTIGHGIAHLYPDQPEISAAIHDAIAATPPQQGHAQLRHTAVRDASGEVVCILQYEERGDGVRDAFLVKLDDATRPMVDPHAITQTAAKHLGEHLVVNRCAYADVEADEDTFNLTGDYNFGVDSIVGRYTFTAFGAECLRLMRANEPYIVEDSEIDPRTEAVRESYRLTRIRSVICVPLHKQGRFVAAMAVHQITPRKWSSHEVELVGAVASRCWESIERARVTRELQQSEARLRLAQRAGRIGSFEWRQIDEQMIWTSELNALFDIDDETLSGDAVVWRERIDPEHIAVVRDGLQTSIKQRVPEFTCEFPAQLPDGRQRWLRAQAQIRYDDIGQPKQIVGIAIDIDERKKYEDTLLEQWHTFDAALSNSLDFVYTFDVDGRFTYANRSLLNLLGKTLDQLIGKTFFELDYPVDLAVKLQAEINQVVRTGQQLRSSTPFTGVTGESRTYQYDFVPICAPDGSVQGVAGSTHDITEQVDVEKRLEEDRRRWRNLLAQSPAAIAVLRGPNFVYEWFNADYTDLVGRTADMLTGKAVVEALPEVEGQIYLPLLAHVYETGESYIGHESPLKIVRDGALVDLYLNFVFAATRNSAGQIDGIFVHATDVTTLVAARKRTEENERQFRTLAETIPNLAWMADETGYIFWYNRRWYEYTGTTFDDMQGWGWQSVHDPDRLPEVMKEWTSSIETGQPFEMTFPIRRADGEFGSFLTRVEPVRDSEGHVVRWFGTNTDITGQSRTEEKLRRMNRELEEFAFVASHDLQEPLRMVNIYTQLILKRLGTDDPALNLHAGFVKQGVGRMETLIRDLLRFSRTVHTEEVTVGNADLNTSLQEAMNVVKERLSESDATVSAENLPTVWGDGPQLAHVFQNLLSNAVKYRRKDVPLTITISSVREGDHCVITVRDNGIGFDPKYATRIFGLFKRLHKEAYPGTGLGLAICQRILERYGGTIWAEGFPGEGAAFHFSLRCEQQI